MPLGCMIVGGGRIGRRLSLRLKKLSGGANEGKAQCISKTHKSHKPSIQSEWQAL